MLLTSCIVLIINLRIPVPLLVVGSNATHTYLPGFKAKGQERANNSYWYGHNWINKAPKFRARRTDHTMLPLSARGQSAPGIATCHAANFSGKLQFERFKAVPLPTNCPCAPSGLLADLCKFCFCPCHVGLSHGHKMMSIVAPTLPSGLLTVICPYSITP